MTSLDPQLAERIASAAVAEGLADAVYAELDSSPIGRLLIAQTDQGIVRISFAEETPEHALAEIANVIGPRVVKSRTESAAALDAIAAYLEGEDDKLPLNADLRLVHGPFRRAVLEHLIEVPRGETVSYGELAKRAGNAKASRATGSACATNPIPILVPCHRVLPGSGKLGNYAGGPERKRTLLTLEGVTSM